MKRHCYDNACAVTDTVARSLLLARIQAQLLLSLAEIGVFYNAYCGIPGQTPSGAGENVLCLFCQVSANGVP